MLINGTITSDKTEILAKKYADLLNSGVKSSEILVIVQNSNRKKDFLEFVYPILRVDSAEKFQVYSFWGLVYNTVSDNWGKIENEITFNAPKLIPALSGLEISQTILKKIVNEIEFKGYNSKKSLLHQLFRRYSLIVQNNLSESEVDARASVLKESFAPDAKIALEAFKKETLALRSLDYLRQGLIFKHLFETTDIFSGIKYLFVDDGDEIIPLCFDFIKKLAPQLDEAFIAYDKLGGSRSGYLSADRTAVWEFEKLFQQQAVTLPVATKTAQDAQRLFDNVSKDRSAIVQNFSLTSLSKRAQIVDFAVEKINSLISSGVKPSEIALVTPIVDEMLKFSLKEKFSKILFVSGNEKLIQNKLVLSILNILKLKNTPESLTEFDLRSVLTSVLKIPLKNCREILLGFEQNKKLACHKFSDNEYNEKYNLFLKTLDELSSQTPLSKQVYTIFDKLVSFKKIDKDEINKFNFFVEQLEDFEEVFADKITPEQIMQQLENSVISDNPYSVFEIEPDQLIVSTPQKIIDNQIRTKFQIWLDVSSDEWVKSDTGPLYNAWVMQAGWDKAEYTLEDNLRLSHEKTARILRKLTLCANDFIWCASSLFDGSGVENFGGIEKYLNLRPDEKPLSRQSFVPREDQKPVLDYKGGKLAVFAVPGAGKTTILLALVLKLIDDGVTPENIYVLTYMESAARNFREKIKELHKNSAQMPNISTIHGLALKILKENSNFERLGLSADFEICDDTKRSGILREVGTKFKIKKLDDYDRAISILKIGGGNSNQTTSDKKLGTFLEFYREYSRLLAESNLIDYDDMLISAVKLLKENPDILAYYQDICEYVIEDEAQDSSSIQQELLGLLSAKHNNLIRCGDTNQAIMTTFSNADVIGFRNFTETNPAVKMDCSQRCTDDVRMLANNLVKFAQTQPAAQDTFYKIFMRPVKGKNPISPNAIKATVFENPFAERNYVLKEIKSTLVKTPNATIGVLLRNNFQVAAWLKFLNDNGLKTISRSECLEQKGVFRAIFAVMKMIEAPFDNEVLAASYETLSELGFYQPRLQVEIRNAAIPFVELNPDDIQNPELSKFYWDVVYWLNFSALLPEELVIKVGLNYFDTEVEKSNAYLISTLVKRLSQNYKNYSMLLSRLEELSKKSNLSGFKFFSQEDKSDRSFLKGKVQIMTMHKSKGDEFDVVFIPEFSESKLPLDFEKFKLKPNDFMENVRALNPDYKMKSEYELKKFNLEENYRLFYVALTRAKRKLYASASTKTKSYGKELPQEASIAFSSLFEGGNDVK